MSNFSPFMLSVQLRRNMPAHLHHVYAAEEIVPGYIEYHRVNNDYLPAMLQGRGVAHKDARLYMDWLPRGGVVQYLPPQPVTLLLADWYMLGVERRATGYLPIGKSWTSTSGYDHTGRYYSEYDGGFEYPDYSDPLEVERAERYEAICARMREIRQQIRAIVEVSA